MAFANVYTVNAWIVDANGTFNYLSGYPKAFNSKNYDNDVNKALQRAKGSFHTTIGNMCAVDNRKVQTVTIHDMYGNEIEPPFSMGEFVIEDTGDA